MNFPFPFWASTHFHSSLRRVAIGAALIFTTAGARAASLQQVSDWDKAGFPADISMYAYVPDQVVDDPPLLVLIHYCGGTAPAVFGQAQGGGVVQAADQYGFVIIAPSSGRCWDVVSDKTRTRDGNGDSHAIRSMVAHAIDKYGINADRVYATGDSSGGMMTELLLGVYPDVFKGGSAMAGMPAACRGDNEGGNGTGYSNACAGGTVSRTPEEWGDIVRSLSPDFSGLRPRVQMFHGDNDTTINYKNLTEAIKEWTDILGLDATPTTEQDGVQLGMHQATRQTWEAACGVALVDAFTSHGGDHGPSDALFLSQYVIPFLGLDRTGPMDPYVETCGGDSGSGGQGSGGTSGDGAGGTQSGAGGTQSASGGTPGSAAGGSTFASGGASSSGGRDAMDASGGGPSEVSGGTSGQMGDTTGGASTTTDGVEDGSQGCSVQRHRARTATGRYWPLVAPVLLVLLRRRRARLAPNTSPTRRA